MSVKIRRTLRSINESSYEAHYLIGLHRYVEFGLEMRRLLEHIGPYEINMNLKEKKGFEDLYLIGDIKSKADLKSHQTTYLRLSADSLVVSSISLFEYLIAGVFVDLFRYSGLENGDISQGLYLVWDEDKKQAFREYCVSNQVGSEAWLEANHRWSEQKSRIKELGKHLGFGMVHLKSEKVGFGWDEFCSMRQRRIGIVHSTGRQSVFQGRDRSEVSEMQKRALRTIEWVVFLGKFIESRIYDCPILVDKEAGKPAAEFEAPSQKNT